MPNLYIISGSNGSGKTTSSYSLLPEMLSCRQYVNSDEFAKSISPYNPAVASIKASRYILQKIHYLMNREETFGIETTLATRSLMNIVNRAQQAGYEVTILYFWLRSPQMAIERVRNRVASGGHFIPDDVVKRRYYMGLNYLFTYYMPICDHWILADNSYAPFKVIAQGNREGQTIVRNEQIFQLIKTLAGNAQKLSDENALL